MGLRALLVGGLVAVGAWYVYENRQQLGLGDAFDGLDDLEAATMGWKNTQQGPVWVPVINQTESALGIPADLLARMAYEESHFRPDVITGQTASSAGAQGILQLEPTSFPDLRLTPPYSTSDTQDQISAAGAYLMQLYEEFQDWSQAVGAYNAGPGTMSNALSTGAALPTETTTYVAQIFADVPIAAVNLPA